MRSTIVAFLILITLNTVSYVRSGPTSDCNDNSETQSASNLIQVRANSALMQPFSTENNESLTEKKIYQNSSSNTHTKSWKRNLTFPLSRIQTRRNYQSSASNSTPRKKQFLPSQHPRKSISSESIYQQDNTSDISIRLGNVLRSDFLQEKQNEVQNFLQLVRKVIRFWPEFKYNNELIELKAELKTELEGLEKNFNSAIILRFNNEWSKKILIKLRNDLLNSNLPNSLQTILKKEIQKVNIYIRNCPIAFQNPFKRLFKFNNEFEIIKQFADDVNNAVKYDRMCEEEKNYLFDSFDRVTSISASKLFIQKFYENQIRLIDSAIDERKKDSLGCYESLLSLLKHYKVMISALNNTDDEFRFISHLSIDHNKIQVLEAPKKFSEERLKLLSSTSMESKSTSVSKCLTIRCCERRQIAKSIALQDAKNRALGRKALE